MKVIEWGMVGAFLVALAFSGSAVANDGTIVTAPEYLDYLDQIDEGLKEGKPKPLSEREQAMFDEAAHSIRGLLAGKESIADLSSDEAIALFNSQETIKAVLSGREEERLMCTREHRVGTNFRQKRCVTLDTQRQEREASQRIFRNLPADIGGELGASVGTH